MELADRFIVDGHFPFTLEHVDLDYCLIILRSGEDFRFLGWNSGVSLNEGRPDPSERLNT